MAQHRVFTMLEARIGVTGLNRRSRYFGEHIDQSYNAVAAGRHRSLRALIKR
jgi:hypothetical protein